MKINTMITCAMMAAMLAICAWLCIIIGNNVITMQTFGVTLVLGLLGGKKGTAAIAIYLALGIVGLPVFCGFRGGIGALLGATGGYIIGFLIWSLLYWLLARIFGEKIKILALIVGLLACYLFGSFWFYHIYAENLPMILLNCVLPYLLPDALKLWLGWLLAKRLKRFVY